MIKTTTRRPGCGCQLNYEWFDDGDDTKNRIHTPVESSPQGHTTVRCESHSHLETLEELHNHHEGK